MSDKGKALIELEAYLAPYRRRDDKIRVRAIYTNLVTFLLRNGLIRPGVISEPVSLSDDFELYESDVTEEGVELFGAPLSRWLRWTDKKNPSADTSILESELKKIRERRG